jgi:hypothetical protein
LQPHKPRVSDDVAITAFQCTLPSAARSTERIYRRGEATLHPVAAAMTGWLLVKPLDSASWTLLLS